MITLYYFGCWDRAGHHWWSGDRISVRGGFHGPRDIPENISKVIDGTFVPANPGVWMFSRVGEWFIMSCIDRTVDSRPGSHSTFIGSGFQDNAEFKAACESAFPLTFKRIGLK